MAQEEVAYLTISWTRLIAISGVFVLIGAIVIAIGYRIGSQGRMLQTEGLDATAVITGKSVQERRGGSGTSATREYSVRYRFSVGNQQYYAQSVVSRAFYESLETGAPAPVRYLAADPSISEIEPGRRQMGSRIAMGIGVLLVLLGVGILLSPRKVRKPS